MPVAPRDNGIPLDQFNAALRASPGWRTWLQRNGLNPDGPLKLSDSQRRAFQAHLASVGAQLPKGMNIDPAGNVNQANQGVFQNRWVQVGLISAAALATMGAAGFGPLAGVLGGGGGVAAGAGTVAGTTAGASSGAGLYSGLFAPTGLVGGAAGAAGAGTVARVAASGAARIPWLDIVLGGGSIAGDLLGTRMAANASREAAEFGLEATREAQRNLREMYETDREDFRPYREAGTGALGRLTGMFESAPRYDLPQSVQRRLTGPGDTYTPVYPGMQSLARLTGSAPRPVGAGQTPAAAAGTSRGGLFSGGKPDWMDENTWRRLSSEAVGYGWGGRRPGDPPSRRSWDTTDPVSTTMPVPVEGGRVSEGMPDGGSGTGHMVKLRAPTGVLFDAPVARVPFYEQQGAQRVGA